MFISDIIMGESCDLCDFNYGMDVGAIFIHSNLYFAQNGVGGEKTTVLLIREVSVKWPG